MEPIPGISIDTVTDRATHLQRAAPPAFPLNSNGSRVTGLDSDQLPILVEDIDSTIEPTQSDRPVISIFHHRPSTASLGTPDTIIVTQRRIRGRPQETHPHLSEEQWIRSEHLSEDPVTSSCTALPHRRGPTPSSS